MEKQSMTNYQKYKDTIMNWRKENYAKFYETNTPHVKKRIEKNKGHCREVNRIKQRRYNAWKQISKVFNILLE